MRGHEGKTTDCNNTHIRRFLYKLVTFVAILPAKLNKRSDMPKLANIIKRGEKLGRGLKIKYFSPIQLQQRTLRRLLKKAADTSFGQYYDFKEIAKSEQPAQAFQEAVPIFDYNRMYDEWWHLTLNKVKNVSWKGKVRYFALSSGTSGAPSKHIPVTDDMLRAMRRASTRMLFNLPRFGISPDLFTKDMLMLGGSTDLQTRGDYYVGDLSGINASKLPFWFRPFYKPGVEIARINDWNHRIEEIAKKAADWDVAFIAGIPSWLQLTLEKVIEYHHAKTIHDVWPHLTVFAHGGIHFEPYKKSFERLLARPLVYLDTYLASEGFIAYQNRPDTHAMKLLLNNGIFLEFVPFNEANFDAEGNIRPDAKALHIEEVQEEVNYALLLSTCAGAWRYLIGDTVKFTDLERCEIVITGRTKHYLSICGEHLSVDNMNSAIQTLETALNVAIPEFTVAAVEQGSFYAHRWYLGCDPMPTADARHVVQLLDEALKKVNDDYGIERRSTLRAPQVQVVPVSMFFRWQEARGKMGGQNKFPRVMQKEMFAQWEAFVQQHTPVLYNS